MGLLSLSLSLLLVRAAVTAGRARAGVGGLEGAGQLSGARGAVWALGATMRKRSSGG
jgi:hypothetical protein